MNFLQKAIPFETKPCIAGIDEAGRGPVLGPLVYAICYSTEVYYPSLKSLGVADSKTLTPSKREDLLNALYNNSNIGWCSKTLSPSSISSNMLKRDKTNLNTLSHNAIIELIRTALSFSPNITQIYIDTVGTPESLQKYLGSLFPRIKITVAKKADSLYPIVSSASIIAKVVRDDLLKNWDFVEKDLSGVGEFGSGYPGDPGTVAWLKNNCDRVFGYPNIIRFSWSTCEKILNSDCVQVTWPEIAELGTTTKKSIVHNGKEGLKSAKRTNFFQQKIKLENGFQSAARLRDSIPKIFDLHYDTIDCHK